MQKLLTLGLLTLSLLSLSGCNVSEKSPLENELDIQLQKEDNHTFDSNDSLLVMMDIMQDEMNDYMIEKYNETKVVERYYSDFFRDNPTRKLYRDDIKIDTSNRKDYSSLLQGVKFFETTIVEVNSVKDFITEDELYTDDTFKYSITVNNDYVQYIREHRFEDEFFYFSYKRTNDIIQFEHCELKDGSYNYYLYDSIKGSTQITHNDSLGLIIQTDYVNNRSEYIMISESSYSYSYYNDATYSSYNYYKGSILDNTSERYRSGISKDNQGFTYQKDPDSNVLTINLLDYDGWDYIQSGCLFKEDDTTIYCDDSLSTSYYYQYVNVTLDDSISELDSLNILGLTYNGSLTLNDLKDSFNSAQNIKKDADIELSKTKDIESIRIKGKKYTVSEALDLILKQIPKQFRGE